MIKHNNSNKLTINKQHRLGSHEEQPLLFSLVHLILCYARTKWTQWSLTSMNGVS